MFHNDSLRTSEPALVPFDRDMVVAPEPALGLAGMPTGAGLALAVAGVDPVGLGDGQLIEYLQATDRIVSWAQAQRAKAVVEVVDRSEDPEFVHLEVGTALRLTRRAAEAVVGLACDLSSRVPRVLDLLAAGLVDMGRARVVVDGVAHLPEEIARVVVDTVVEAAPDLTAGQLRARLARLVVEVDPDGADARHREAVEERRVVAHPGPDGTGTIVASDLPADRVAAAMGHLDRLARNIRRAGDDRTADQVRADLLLDLLSGSCAHHPTRRAVASISVDLATARGEADRAGDIPGWGPVPAQVARRILAEDHPFEWRIGGALAAGPTSSRRPTVGLRRAVEARHPTCVFPGCRLPARTTDLDHTIAVEDGGSTSVDNLAPLCRHHHRAKHEAGWRYVFDGGLVTWTSPLGRSYASSGRPS